MCEPSVFLLVMQALEKLRVFRGSEPLISKFAKREVFGVSGGSMWTWKNFEFVYIPTFNGA
mgnify:CR=1 FL=1